MDASQHEVSLDTLRLYYRDAEAEAMRLGGEKWPELFSLYATQLFNHGAYDELITVAVPALRRMPKGDDYFDVCSILVSSYRQKGLYETSMETTRHMYEDARRLGSVTGICSSLYMMGQLYVQQKLYVDAEKCFRECISYSAQHKGDMMYALFAYNALASMLISENKLVEAGALFPAWTALVERFEKTGDKHWGPRFQLYCSLTYYYYRNKEIDKAESYLAKAKSIARLETVNLEIYHYEALIAEAHQQYVKALHIIDEAYSYAMKYSYATESLLILDDKIRILTKLGNRNAEIYPLLQLIRGRSDSLRQVNTENRLNELRTRYRLDKVEDERKIAMNRVSYMLLAGSLLLVILVLVVYYTYRLHKMNSALFRHIKEQDRLYGLLHAPVTPLSSSSILPGEVEREELAASREESVATEELATEVEQEEVQSRMELQQRNLMDSLDAFLRKEGVLERVVDLTDDDLAAELITNRTTLRNAVKAVANKTLKEYIQDIQLAEARHRLETEYNQTIESIATECGFSKRTFYRLFKERYNISPTQYKELARQSQSAG
jgi:AraC-like DNA-binding protein